MDSIDKKKLSESDICDLFITPAVKNAGWDQVRQVRREMTLTPGPVVVRGNMSARNKKKKKFADYVLSWEPGIPLAVIEAKDNNHSVSHGMQQALGYAEILAVPSAFSSNGDAFASHNNVPAPGEDIETQFPLDRFPAPQTLWQRYKAYRGIEETAEELVLQPYHTDSSGKEPRYYQVEAVNRVVEAVARGQKRVLLVMATGTGGFLVCAIDHKRQCYVKTAADEEILQASIRGVEKKSLPHMLCVTNMILHGIDTPSQIKHDNTLSRPLRDYGNKDRVEVIVTKLPFGGMEEDGIENNFPAAFRTWETADLFMTLIIHLLKTRGRAAVVLPDGFFFGEGMKTRLKEKLLTECNLHTIVRLPNGVFNPYAGIKTNLLFFTKGEPTKAIWYYEHQYPEGVKSYNKTKPMHFEEFQTEIDWWGSETDGFVARDPKKTGGRGWGKKTNSQILYGIKKLRELILELAVRGKLVPQDPSDEPASILLKRIAKEKARLVKEGKIKKQKKLPEIMDEEKPFELPVGWEWVRLGDVMLKITDGTHHSPKNTETGDYLYMSAKNIKDECVLLNHATYVTKKVHPPLGEQHRIVAKVNELMAFCDALKSRLQDAQTTQVHLADAMVKKVVA